MDKIKMIAQSTVLSMGFTKAMIDKLLPPPTLKTNPRYHSAAPMRTWAEADVLAVIETDEFKTMSAAYAKRRASAEKAVETKAAKAAAELDEILNGITVEVVDLDQLRRKALAARQAWYNYNDRGGDYRNAYDAGESTVKRWMVNFIRHNLCTYDDNLTAIFGKVGKDALYARLKSATLAKIAAAYPALAAECKNQEEHNGI